MAEKSKKKKRFNPRNGAMLDHAQSNPQKTSREGGKKVAWRGETLLPKKNLLGKHWGGEKVEKRGRRSSWSFVFDYQKDAREKKIILGKSNNWKEGMLKKKLISMRHGEGRPGMKSRGEGRRKWENLWKKGEHIWAKTEEEGLRYGKNNPTRRNQRNEIRELSPIRISWRKKECYGQERQRVLARKIQETRDWDKKKDTGSTGERQVQEKKNLKGEITGKYENRWKKKKSIGSVIFSSHWNEKRGGLLRAERLSRRGKTRGERSEIVSLGGEGGGGKRGRKRIVRGIHQKEDCPEESKVRGGVKKLGLAQPVEVKRNRRPLGPRRERFSKDFIST